MKIMRNFPPPTVLVLLLPLILMSPLLFTGKAMFWGTVSLQFLPWSVMAARIIQSGQIPLWNPLVGMGSPLLANYQSGLLYPPNWLVLFAAAGWGAGWAAVTQTWLVALHLIWGGLGMVALARRLGLSQLAQTVCGLAFALSGYMVSRSGFISINATVAWVPWVILVVTDLSSGKITFGKIAKAGIVICMLLLAGHAQSTWYTLLFAGAWSGVISWLDSHSLNNSPGFVQANSTRFKFTMLISRWIALGGAVVLAVSLAAVQLLPTAELFLQSQRARAVEFEYAMTYSYWPWRFLTLLAPNLFGSPVSENYWGYGNYWEDALYIGAFPILLVLLVVLGTFFRFLRKKKSIPGDHASNNYIDDDRFVTFLIVMVVISFIFALGTHTPIFPWLYFNIPTFSAFQAPTRFSLWAVISLILLAGIGVDRIKKPEGRALYWTRLGTAGAGAVSLGAGLAWYLLGDISTTFIGATALFGIFALCAGILVLTTPVRGGAETQQVQRFVIWKWVFLCVVGFDLMIADWNMIPGIEREFYDSVPSSAISIPSIIGGQRIYIQPDDEYDLKFNRFMRFDSYSIDEKWSNLREVLLPNINILEEIPSANNFDPLISARYARWMDALHEYEEAGDDPAITRSLNLMGVGMVEYLNSADDLGVSFFPVQNSTRIRWLPCAHYVRDGEDAWNLLFNEDVDLERGVILESVDNTSALGCTEGLESASITIIEDKSDRITVRVDAPVRGWLVLSDVWYPGWNAEIDGKSTPVLRANYLFRAVALPPGEHEVSWKYQSIIFWVGFSISLSAWIILGLIWLVRTRVNIR